ncbi:MAG: TerC/Alx family metal homeostasis membrane protein [Phycisphaerales bacterium]|nr:MAG: TerC/Alx family metal homeostasis membrane protein [Phycisphaerales bacterium]
MAFWLWAGFIAVILSLLALDLGVVQRRARAIPVPEAAAWTTTWVILALAFNVGVFFLYEHHILGIGLELGHELSGGQAALQFFSAYVIEKSLSIDNIFVIAVIFAYWRVPAAYQHRVLFWGILGALVLRGIMIAAGIALIERVLWMTYVFGGLLLVTAVKMLVARHDNLEPDRNPLVRLARKIYPVSDDSHQERFFTRIDGRRAITPLLLVLITVESADVLFALDSIPAVFAVTRDPFLVFTSNVFAILGLRSLYFVLAGVMDRFRYLKVSLVFLLAFVGVKMLLAHHHPIPALVSLGVISGILAVGVLASILAGHRDSAPLLSPLADELEDLVEYSWKQVRRILILLAGATLLLAGLAMIVLPGPAILAIPAGLAMLGSEFLWARQLLAKMRRAGSSVLRGLDEGNMRGGSRKETQRRIGGD